MLTNEFRDCLEHLLAELVASDEWKEDRDVRRDSFAGCFVELPAPSADDGFGLCNRRQQDGLSLVVGKRHLASVGQAQGLLLCAKWGSPVSPESVRRSEIRDVVGFEPTTSGL
jgi:hypothetical protein